MTILSRMTRLFKADVHGLLDSIEDPRTMLNLAIRDMTSEIESLEEQLAQLTKHRTQLNAQIADASAKIKTFQGQISMSFEAGNDELARHFVRQKLMLEAHQKQLKGALEHNETHCQSLSERRNKYTLQLEEIKTKADILTPPHSPDSQDAPSQAAHAPSTTVDHCDVEIAFLTLKTQWENRQAKTSCDTQGGSSQ